MNLENTKECPYCAEQILLIAKKCRHCGEFVDHQLREIEALKKQIHNSANNNNNGLDYSVRKTFKHFWHVILAIITGGFWIPFWFLLYIFRNKRIYE